MGLAYSSSNGDILGFSKADGYYHSDQVVVAELVKIFPDNSTVITYGNVALTFQYPRVVDLPQANVVYLSQMLNGISDSEISTTLRRNGFYYILLPSPSNFQWGAFQHYLGETPTLQRIMAAPGIVTVQGFQDWTLYNITAYGS
jgi:hypothetical protein